MFFFFNNTPTSAIYTLSLHDALPISIDAGEAGLTQPAVAGGHTEAFKQGLERCRPAVHGRRLDDFRNHKTLQDRKSTRLNSSHQIISYAVFCLKKKKQKNTHSNVMQK